jgi:hypothetical protein
MNAGKTLISRTCEVPNHKKGTYVCDRHGELVSAGAAWDFDARHNVLMGEDMPPALEDWSARPSAGSEGFTLFLTLSGQPQPIAIFLTATEAKTFSSFIKVVSSDI